MVFYSDFASFVSLSVSWSNILKLIFPERPSLNYFCIVTLIDVLYSTFYLYILLLQHGHIETNLGPSMEKIKNLSCCHWNVNSQIAHNLSKIYFLEAYNSIYKHDFLFTSETQFDFSALEGNENMQLIGYNMIRVDI